MAILEADVQIVASQVLADVPEGGGAATGEVIADGVSNNLFPDISELDRVYGNVGLRKIFVAIRTLDTDAYMGAHVIVADAPDDPDVSCVLFSTGDAFDTRDTAAGRIESYLAQGAAYPGLLFGNHIAGQMAVTLIQRENVPLPSVGDTIVLRKNEGLTSEVEQFVRVNDVSSSRREFSDQFGGDFARTLVVLEISDQLREDFTGFDAVRYDASVSYVGKTKVYETLVADAARYYGIVPLAEEASLGDFTVEAEGIFSQLVPSSRAETPIADARVNQVSAALIAAGSPIAQSISTAFTATQPMYVGGGILPGSLSVVRGGVTLLDDGGVLKNAGVSVGTIDYENGVLMLSTNVFGTGTATHTVTYTPAATPSIVTDSIGIPVTQTTQRLNWTLTLDPAPARGSLQVSYLAQGRWYVMRDTGSGAIRGSDSSIGAGMLNFSTGTISITLGALPDVGSRIIFGWARKETASVVSAAELAAGARFAQVVDLGVPIKPGELALTWSYAGSKSATDLNGALVGDATGIVYYAAGRVVFSPNALPTDGTVVTADVVSSVLQDSDIASFTDGGSAWTKTVTAPVRAKSVEMSVVVQYPVREFPGIDVTRKTLLHVFDDGAGVLYTPNTTGNLAVGTVNSSTGALSINKSIAGYLSEQGVWGANATLGTSVPPKIEYKGSASRTVTLTVLNGPGGDTVDSPAWAWFGGNQAVGAKLRYSGADGSSSTLTFAVDSLTLTAAPDLIAPADGQWGPIRFTLGGELYTTRADKLLKNIDPATGNGLEVGTTYGYTVTLNTWTAGISPLVTTVSGATVPPTSGALTRMLSDGVTFRTASAPLVPSGFSIQGEFEDGTTFNAASDTDGIINADGVVGTIDFQTGIAEIRFGETAGGAGTGILDLSYLGIPGVTNVTMRQARTDTLRYNAVAYSYLPLDASILGLDPVRLPSDGRVPIFRPGSVAVVHHTANTSPATVSNGQTINVGRERIARARVIGNNGATITAGYAANLDAGTITFSNVTGYSQPVHIEHRIEDAALVADAQISGLIRFTRHLTHDFPIGSQISSALIVGNLFARVSSLFDQVTWTNVWSDDLIGSAAGASYDVINHPPEVFNEGAVTERWALVFGGTTTFSIFGEHLGLIGTGNTAADCMPLNPQTGTPYFILRSTGFGSGWPAGSVIRLNTVGALAPVWVARVIQQGEPTETNDSFTLLVRGDVDTP